MQEKLLKLVKRVVEYFDLRSGNNVAEELDLLLKTAGMGTFSSVVAKAKANAETNAKEADEKIAAAERELNAARDAYNAAVQAANRARVQREDVANATYEIAEAAKVAAKKILAVIAKYS